MKSLPIACTLNPGDLQERLALIRGLTAEALLGHDRDGLVLALRYAPEAVERVRAMVANEQHCCAFLNFEVREQSDVVHVTINPQVTGSSGVPSWIRMKAPRTTGAGLQPGSALDGLAGKGRDIQPLRLLVEEEFKPTHDAAINPLRLWAVPFVTDLRLAGRALPRHHSIPRRKRRVRWRYSNGPHVRHVKRSQRSVPSLPMPLNNCWQPGHGMVGGGGSGRVVIRVANKRGNLAFPRDVFQCRTLTDFRLGAPRVRLNA
jgi:hypothetical protein